MIILLQMIAHFCLRRSLAQENPSCTWLSEINTWILSNGCATPFLSWRLSHRWFLLLLLHNEIHTAEQIDSDFPTITKRPVFFHSTWPVRGGSRMKRRPHPFGPPCWRPILQPSRNSRLADNPLAALWRVALDGKGWRSLIESFMTVKRGDALNPKTPHPTSLPPVFVFESF